MAAGRLAPAAQAGPACGFHVCCAPLLLVKGRRISRGAREGLWLVLAATTIYGATALDTQVVDTFADARDRDILNLAEEMEQDMEADKRCSALFCSHCCCGP